VSDGAASVAAGVVNGRGGGLGTMRARCLLCGEYHRKDLAAFVKSKSTGERIVNMFRPGVARLDYREYELDWIQVKVCA
jgi:hypothetical protein